MAEEDQDSKTEEPTGKRLNEAREEGRIPISRETTTWVSFLGILLIVAWIAPAMGAKLVVILRFFLEMPHAMALDDQGLQTLIYQAVVQVVLATGLIFVVMAAAAILGVIGQTGLFYSFNNLTPDLMRLSPLTGIRRLVSMMALAELGKSFAKLVVLGAAVYFLLRPVAIELPGFVGRPLLDVMSYFKDKAVHMLVILLLIFTFIAVADLWFQRFQYNKSLRMTKAEVKDEFKQQEGDPMIKSRLRQLRMEKARKRMMAQVPKADVIVTNPTHYAIALKYDSNKMGAPMVLAKGINLIADRIRELAEDHHIPLVSNPPLARALYDTVEIDREIPTQHYRAVAEVISYVYKLKKRRF